MKTKHQLVERVNWEQVVGGEGWKRIIQVEDVPKNRARRSKYFMADTLGSVQRCFVPRHCFSQGVEKHLRLVSIHGPTRQRGKRTQEG